MSAKLFADVIAKTRSSQVSNWSCIIFILNFLPIVKYFVNLFFHVGCETSYKMYINRTSMQVIAPILCIWKVS